MKNIINSDVNAHTVSMDRWKGLLFSLNAVAKFSHQGQIKKTTLPEESLAKKKKTGTTKGRWRCNKTVRLNQNNFKYCSYLSSMVLSSSLATWPTSANLEPTSVFSCETNLSNSEHVTNLPVFRIRGISVDIRNRGSVVLLTNGSGSCSFSQ